MREISFRKRMAVACCFSALSTAACAVSAPAPELNAELSGTHWVVSAIDGAPPVSPDQAPRINFGGEDRLSGSSGCNNVFAVYEARDGHIDVRALGHTERACDAGVMRQEQAFLTILDRASRYERRDDELIIHGENGASLSFERLG